ncbi:MAG: hypothetical protein IJA01_06465 [Firmicutes bacterium]|nr:hypothetical protein [Bacillota bacterium]
MRKKIISWITIIMMMTTVFSVTAFADTEVDRTAPALKSIAVIDGDNVTSETEWVQVQIEAVEEGTGICAVELRFEGSETTYFHDVRNGDEMNGELLFTGTHTFPIWIQNHFDIGVYRIESVHLTDSNGNTASYYLKEDTSIRSENAKITVVENKVVEEYGISVSDISFSPSDNINAGDKLAMTFTIDEITAPLYYLAFVFKNNDTENSYQFDQYVKDLSVGTHTLYIDLNNEIPTGTFNLDYLRFHYGIGEKEYSTEFTYDDDPDFFDAISITVTESTLNGKPLELTNVEVNSKDLTAPAVLTLTMDFNTNGNTLYWADVAFETDYGKIINYENLRIKEKDGRYYVNIPMSPFSAEGELKLEMICIQEVQYISDTGPDEINYYNRHLYDFFSNADINLKTQYDITYFGSLGNAAALEAVRNLEEGQTAVLDCRYYKTVSKDYFLAIAGKDVTLALIDENVQWVFNGKNVSKSKCKAINISSTIKVVDGAPYGYASDTKIALLIFRNNGELPGEVDMRVDHEYLAEKYNFNKTNMKLTYLDANNNAFLEDSDVDVAGDDYYEYEVDHNSTFALSKNKAKIGKPKITEVPRNLSSTKIKWSKTSGNGYYVYRATSKNGKFKKIKTIKSRNTTEYVDYNVKTGKSYYYKVKPYSKYKSYNSTAKTSSVIKVKPRLATPTITSCKKVSSKTQIKVKWSSINWSKANQKSRYYVYRSTSKNGTYKKIATVNGSRSYVDKKVKKNKTYYYKVKAVHKKYNSYSSNRSGYKYCKL